LRLPSETKDVTPEQREAMDKLIERLEEDDDVTNVFHNMKPEE
jgi:transcriptional/translational regulatory protein YebC/TACO1